MSQTANQREITLNGRPVATEAATLGELLAEQGFDGKIATAVNGSFVAERRRAQAVLNVGDRVEVVSARQGG
jgi:sulfur carrier protein